MNVSLPRALLPGGLTLTGLSSQRSPPNIDINSETMDLLATYCVIHPEYALCETGFYGYKLNFHANATFAILFTMCAAYYAVGYAITRRGLDFTLAMLLGVVCEIIGYGGRLGGVRNQFNDDFFFMQICCLTVGPAFMAAGLYLCMRRIVFCFGEGNSRIPPKYYTRVFIPCDVVSLCLQATGGALAAIAYKHAGSIRTGDNIMLAGLAFQVFTMLVFIVCALDFGLRTYVRYKLQGRQALDQTESIVAVRNSVPFRLFLAALIFATLCIFARCCFRVAELSGGWTGPLMRDQIMFIVFESSLVCLASFVLVIFHPSWTFKSMIHSTRGLAPGWIRWGNRPRANAVSEGSVDDGRLVDDPVQQAREDRGTNGEDERKKQSPQTVPVPTLSATGTPIAPEESPELRASLSPVQV